MAKTAIIIANKPEPPEDGVKIKAPDGFKWPDDVDPEKGEKFIVTAVPSEDGAWIILKDFDGIPLDKEPDNESEDSEAEQANPSAEDMFSQTMKSYGK